jgi:hypothetical protein
MKYMYKYKKHVYEPVYKHKVKLDTHARVHRRI